MEARVWWYRVGEAIEGPVSQPSLTNQVRLGRVGPDTPVARLDPLSGQPSFWQPARSFGSLNLLLRQLGRIVQQPEEPKVAPLRPLYETAPKLELRPGKTLSVISVQKGEYRVFRALGEIVRAWTHFVGTGSEACLGAACPYCPKRRSHYGYVDALLTRHNIRSGETEYYRAVQSISEAAANQIELADGELLQGRLLSLHWRGSGAPTQVETLQTSCPYELPEPADVYAALCARYGLDAWPDQDRTSPQARPADPNILQFRRKQA